jgi:predicted DNA-binding transcriptional regulator AlpA
VEEDVRLLNANEVAQRLGTSRTVIYNSPWRRRIGLPAVHVGRALRFRVADVEALIQRGLEDDARGRAPKYTSNSEENRGWHAD